MGLNTICISVMGTNEQKNKNIYAPHLKEYPNLISTIKHLHSFGYSIRLTITMAKDFVCSPKDIKELVEFAKIYKVEQLSITPVRYPESSGNDEADKWAKKHGLSKEEINVIKEWIEKNGTPILTLMHGAVVYDLDGQNICFKDCLTLEGNTDNIRQLIFFPDGSLRYDWQYSGAILL